MRTENDHTELASWTERLTQPPIPALAATIRELQALKAHEELIDANCLGEVVASDPLMTLRLMAQVAKLRGLHQLGDPQTVTAGLVWLGIGPFFRLVDQIQPVEQTLAQHPAALQGLARKLTVNRRAARLAHAFAVEQSDPDAARVHHAALLDDFPQLLLWVHEPVSALRIASIREIDPLIPESEAQLQVLGVEMAQLRSPISRVLRLPRMLQPSISRVLRLPSTIEQGDGLDQAELPSAQCVQIAVRIAVRESAPEAAGLRPEADPEDFATLIRLLDVSEERLLTLISEAGR